MAWRPDGGTDGQDKPESAASSFSDGYADAVFCWVRVGQAGDSECAQFQEAEVLLSAEFSCRSREQSYSLRYRAWDIVFAAALDSGLDMHIGIFYQCNFSVCEPFADPAAGREQDMALPYSGHEADDIGQVEHGVDGGFGRDDLYGGNW